MKKISDDKKPDVEKDDPHRQIVPRLAGAAREIYDFLETLFDITENDAAPGEIKTGVDVFPESVQLKMAGRGGVETSAADLMSFDFKPTKSAMPSREKLVEMANAFARKAQQDADALGRNQRYGIFAYSNAKGSASYGRCLFNIDGSAKRDSASDDEDTHRDRLLSASLAHARWQQEQFAEAITGVMALQRDTITQLRDSLAQSEHDRRQMILVYEESLSKDDERKRANEWARFKMDALKEALDMLRPLLPVVQAYLTKGKAGLVEGVRKFLDSLTGEQKLKLFGIDDGGGEGGAPAILTAEQRILILRIADGEEEPKKLAEFATSLSTEQITAAQDVLTAAQASQLYGLSQAAMKAASEPTA